MKDVKFMTAKEKERVLKHWCKFLDSGLSMSKFTHALYKYLSLHCSFIAHYNRTGFWCYYFQPPRVHALDFIRQFDRGENPRNRATEINASYWLRGDFEDLNQAMVDECSARAPRLTTELRAELGDLKLQELRRLGAELGYTITKED